jgi:hypothetical protein
VPDRRLRRLASIAALIGLVASQAAAAQGARDPDNPTCPPNPNWSSYSPMRLTVERRGDARVLLAEGTIDDNLPQRLEAVLAEYPDQIDEIWLRSPGGNARAGNAAGYIIREAGLPTRIPSGWACFSACNFMFMGGAARFVDPGGLFIVHMFTQLADGSWARRELQQGTDRVGLVATIEQSAALLATEDNDFLIRMGISRALLSDVMYQVRAVAAGSSRETRRCLTPDEVRQYNVVNGPVG